jgi:malate synthase
MTSPVAFGQLGVAPVLFEFIRNEALPGTGISELNFWRGLEAIVNDLAPRNAELLRHRDHLQLQIDNWHRSHPGSGFDRVQYANFLEEIGYLEPPIANFQIDTRNIDPEIASIAAPQLVVPLDNARYALNAANARWGSLFDALYGTDALDEQDGALRAADYNPVRGARVIRYTQDFLDRCFPLKHGFHRDAIAYVISERGGLEVRFADGMATTLSTPSAFRGYTGATDVPTAIFLIHHGLHVEIRLDRMDAVGSTVPTGLRDVWLESALTTIQDCEDSVAAVDADDKVRVYRNWLGLMTGTLAISFMKGNQRIERRLEADRYLRAPNGDELTLPGRSLMLVRHVGQHILSESVTLHGRPVPETFLDAAITALIAMKDGSNAQGIRNSRFGSIYCVKPKMHGSSEVAFADELFGRIERLLGLHPNSLKLGLMDEERRTSLNLKQCLYAARHRLFFINTGFLDRTGDDIHTCMTVGPMMRKRHLRKAGWLNAYERNNVQMGLQCGLAGRAQIGKGMWTEPDRMAAMLATKIGHLQAGASTSWVPSPTAATLHALHYHEVSVADVQAHIRGLPPVVRGELLEPALDRSSGPSSEDIEEDLDSNVQSILGYVVRWIDQGIGCSKVLDVGNTALMEDRATLRISSQLIANWLCHGVCTRAQVEASLTRMAPIVDAQNSGDTSYSPLALEPGCNLAMNAASELIFNAQKESNGYTEGVLFRYRLSRKLQASRSPANAARLASLASAPAVAQDWP